ncbi:MAG: protein kinase [Candidatus Zixiibacteriota bacterium]|jgi:serine/threonine protein kinase/Tfp pilus assembly protein PilF
MPDDKDRTRTHVVLTKGTMVQHYRILEKIGAGGMGEVYLAEDTKLERRVALKFLPTHLATNDDIRARFVREARTVAKLNHPNIVSIYEVGQYHDRPFYAMELVEGESLKGLVKGKPLPFDTIIEFAIQICQGLGEAHRAGIIHRDIKTANIAVDTRGRVRLLDFGLAAMEGGEKITKSGSTLGTVAYMSPEQISGREVDNRSDLFSLGIVLYELIAGHSPFERDNDGATLRAIVEDNPEPLSRYRSDVSDRLNETVLKLLEKDKELRYQSAEGVIADLKRLSYDSRPSGFVRDSKKSGWRKIYPYATAGVAVLVVLFAYLYFNSGSGETDSDIPVLAVLPFENLGSVEDGYFSEGITDEIRSRLTTLEGVRILSRNAAEKFRNTDKTAREIGAELGADYLLEGTIRWDKSGEVERFRITSQLTEAQNEYQLWSESYSRNLTEIFAVQAEIAGQISQQLGLTLMNPEEIKSAASPTSNLEAYNYYLKGLEVMRKGIFNIGNLREAVDMFDSAIALDSNFALAWAQKARACIEFEFAYKAGKTEYAADGRTAAVKALELNPRLPEGHIALGTYYNLIERDYDRALAEFSRAKSEVSSNADISEAIGIVKMRQGKWLEAIANYEEAAHIDPLNTKRYFWLATCYSLIRDYSRAIEYINRSYTLAPDNDDAVFFKLRVNLLKFGELDAGELPLDKIISKIGIARAVSWEVDVSNVSGLWRFVPEKYLTRSSMEELRSIRNRRSPTVYYMNTAELFRLMGHNDSSRIYLDSARTLLEEITGGKSYNFFSYGALGLIYARLGMNNKAVAAGQKAKEMMAVDDCHW